MPGGLATGAGRPATGSGAGAGGPKTTVRTGAALGNCFPDVARVDGEAFGCDAFGFAPVVAMVSGVFGLDAGPERAATFSFGTLGMTSSCPAKM